MRYQKKYSSINPIMFDTKSREIKAKKILAVIKDFLEQRNQSLDNKTCLDIGGSTGFVAKKLSPFARKITVIDIDRDALSFGRKYHPAKNISYRVADAMRLPFKNNSFDIIVCNQVYEHVPNYFTLAKEIQRVLTDDGLCYFGAVNKFVLIEPHYNLPFLSWLPKKLANLYSKLARGKKGYYENLLSYNGLKKLLKGFIITDYSINIIKDPEKFYALDMIKKNSIISRIPRFILTILMPLFPVYIFVLTKK